MGEHEAVVGDGDLMLEGGAESGAELLGGDDASTALNDNGIVGDGALDWGVASEDVEVEGFACVVGNEVGEFDAADVFAGDVVGAGFEEEEAVAVVEAVDGEGALDVLIEESFGAGEEDAEGGEGDVVGDDAGDLVEGLAVGDDEPRGAGKGGERLGELLWLTIEGYGVVVEDVAQDLYLGEYHSAFGGGGVDGCDEEDDVVGGEDGAEERGVDVGGGGEGGLDEVEQGLTEGGVVDGEGEDGGGELGLDGGNEVGVGGVKVDLGADDEVRDGGRLARLEKISLGEAEIVLGEKEYGEVHLGELVVGALDTEGTEVAEVVEAGGIDEDDGAYARDFHRLTDGVGGGAGGVGDNGDGLIGEEIEQGTLAEIASSEDADMGF